MNTGLRSEFFGFRLWRKFFLLRWFSCSAFFVSLMFVPQAGAEDCESLSLLQCFRSKSCTIDCGHSRGKRIRCAPYRCREKRGECELGPSQSELTKENCEARRGCVFYPPKCFCPGPMDCTCGQGPPARCLPEGTNVDA